MHTPNERVSTNISPFVMYVMDNKIIMKDLAEIFNHLRKNTKESAMIAYPIEEQSVHAPVIILEFPKDNPWLDSLCIPFKVIRTNDYSRYTTFVFDTRLPLSPHQESLEKSTGDDFYNGYITGAARANDVDLTRRFLEHRKETIVQKTEWWCMGPVDDIYYGAFTHAACHSKVELVRLFLEFGYKIPDNAMDTWHQNFSLNRDSVETLKLLLDNGGCEQVNIEMFNECVDSGAMAFEMACEFADLDEDLKSVDDGSEDGGSDDGSEYEMSGDEKTTSKMMRCHLTIMKLFLDAVVTRATGVLTPKTRFEPSGVVVDFILE